jgi:hypothetical protein
MNRKRALLYLLSGLVCAVVAIWILQKQHGGQKPGTVVETEKVFVATKTIPFGTPLDIYDAETKQGNIFQVPWPRKMLPEGVITDPKVIAEGRLVALSTFVRNEPILLRKTAESGRIIPPGMFLFDVDVPRSDIEKFRPGDFVDIFVVEAERKVVPFAINMRIYCIGRISWPREREPAESKSPAEAKDLPPKLYLLAKEDDRMLLLQARINYGTWIVEPVPSGRDTSGGPILLKRQREPSRPPEPPTEPTEPVETGPTSEQRVNQARALIAQAEKEKWDQNIKTLEQAQTRLVAVTKDEPHTSPWYGEARALLGTIENRRMLFQKRHQWDDLRARIEDALEKGRLAECRRTLDEADAAFDKAKLAGGEPELLVLAQQVGRDVLEYRAVKLVPRERELRRQYTLFDNLLKNDRFDLALQKFEALKNAFPESEETKEASRRLKEKGLLK